MIREQIRLMFTFRDAGEKSWKLRENPIDLCQD
ncbi:MAG: hypothetical protein BWY76_01766 [bacterium ADurb.Bin429]|nr:MAG: hypothetical protein BWY76_01766 [bacterium ADurb.Bin429]